MSTVTGIVLHYYPQREKYLPMILAKLYPQVDELILVSNRELTMEPKWPKTVQSTINFGIGLRLSIAALCQTDWVFTQDDDLTVRPRTVANLIKQNAGRKQTLIGLQGKILDGKEYKFANHVSGVVEPTYVSTLVGRLMLYEPEAARIALREISLTSKDDDLLLARTGHSCLVVPYGEDSYFDSLDEQGVGLSYEPDHYERRGRLAKALEEWL